jgi:hypothetical protein
MCFAVCRLKAELRTARLPGGAVRTWAYLDTATVAWTVPVRSTLEDPEPVPYSYRLSSSTPLRAGTARAPAVAVSRYAR